MNIVVSYMPEYQVESQEFPSDTFSQVSVPSSPVESSVLSDLHDVQKERYERLYKYQTSPESSPIKSSPTRSAFNLRNKHIKSRQLRQNTKNDTLDLHREKFSDKQARQDYERTNLEQWELTYQGLDVEDLIQEEQEEMLAREQQELAEREMMEEQEIASMLADLKID